MSGLNQTPEGPGIGPPLPALLSFADEARFWVNFADPVEVEVYAWTCFHAMPVQRQAAFLTKVGELA